MKIIELQQKLDQKVNCSLVYTLWCVYIARDRDRGGLGFITMCRNIFTVPTPEPMQISIGFCTLFIGLDLGVGQFK